MQPNLDFQCFYLHNDNMNLVSWWMIYDMTAEFVQDTMIYAKPETFLGLSYLAL